MTNSKAVRGLVISLVAVQLFDIAIHIGTSQVEPVRILSNGIIGIWAIWSLFNKAVATSALVAILLYLGLNMWFLAMHGISNPDQGGALRVTLFVLVGLSTATALWLRTKINRD